MLSLKHLICASMFALCRAGLALAFVVHDLISGAALIDRALALNPNHAAAWGMSGWVKISLGEPELAIEHLTRCMRLTHAIR
jgi:hypothetical protein